MINVYAAVAQEERRMISDRTKAGLAAAKARGVKLGGPRTVQQNFDLWSNLLPQRRAACGHDSRARFSPRCRQVSGSYGRAYASAT
jgi:DNA invertase Pin-like site-specific DNA recombinase